MTFGKSRFNENEFELLRFCNKLFTNVVGGASRLLSHFKKMHPEIQEIVSYADRRWSRGQLYEKLGFKKEYVTDPNYYYIVDRKRKNRMLFQKHKLVADGADPNKTEREIMKEKGFKRIYDCGSIKYSLNLQSEQHT